MRRLGLLTVMVLSVLLVWSTEIVSLFNALNRGTLAVFWTAVLLVALAVGIKTRVFPPFLTLTQNRLRAFWRYAASSPFRFLLILALLIFVALVGLVAISTAPNNYDSLTYHIARVAHWAQNSSVSIYPTIINRQYEYPPFAEYGIAHLQILSGGDRFANMVQFGAYLGCILLVGLIAKAMGMRADGQLVAGVVVATVPMGILEATSTQNDWVNAFWLLGALYWVIVSDKYSLRTSALLVGTCLAIGTFVKFPAPLYAFPILVWFLARAVCRFGIRQTLTHAVTLMALLLVLVQGIHYTHRAVLAYQSLTQPPINGSGVSVRAEFSFRYLNRKIGAPTIISNVVRNIGNHLGLPIPAWNQALTQFIVWLHRNIGADVNDPAARYGYWEGIRFVMHDDFAGNFLHLILALLAIPWIVLGRDVERQRWRAYTAVMMAGILIFILVVKWMPWHSRLQTPWFAMTAPLIALMLLRTLGYRWASLAALALVICALPFLFWNATRPLLGAHSVLVVPRSEQYLASNPQFVAPYHAAAAYTKQLDCNQVGLVIQGNDMEYPLFPLLTEGFTRPVRIEHVNVVNASQFTESAYPPFDPCVILGYKATETEITHHGNRYVRSKTWEPLSVFEKR